MSESVDIQFGDILVQLPDVDCRGEWSAAKVAVDAYLMMEYNGEIEYVEVEEKYVVPEDRAGGER